MQGNQGSYDMATLTRSPFILLALTGSLLFPGFAVAADPQTATASARPDLSGVWESETITVVPVSDGKSVCIVECEELEAVAAETGVTPGLVRSRPERPVYRPEFQARVEALDKNQVLEDPVLYCKPPGVPRIGPPDKIVQTAKEVVFLYDDVNGSFFRVVPVDGRGHRDIEETYLGDATGRWEGDTLVVETVNFNEDSWLTDDGAFHSKDLRVIERLSRDGDNIRYEVIVHDPAVLAEPWVRSPRILTPAVSDIQESPLCIESSLPFMEDLSNHDNPR